MSNETIHDIVMQNAIYEGEPYFMPLEAAINLINHHSFGGTPSDFEEVLKDESMDKPKRYAVTLTLSYKELT